MTKAWATASALGLFSGDTPWKIDYDKHGERLKLLLPQKKMQRQDGTFAGVNASGVYVEMARADVRAEEPFFHIALVPGTSIATLETRLRANDCEAYEWPITHTPRSWHRDTHSNKAWEQARGEPSMVVPKLLKNPEGPRVQNSINPLFDKMETTGFFTPRTAKAIRTALNALGNAEPGKFSKRLLEEELRKVYSAQIAMA